MSVSKESSISSPRKQMAEVKQAVIVVVCHVENPAQHF